MNIFIATDMEGATGVVHPDQLTPEGKTYNAAKILLTQDICAAIEGVVSVDPNAQFIIGDGHGVMRNVILEMLPENSRLVVGPGSASNKPLCQMQGINNETDLVFMIGFHSKAGTNNGLLAHTFVGSTICNFYCNSKPVGEVTVNAAIAADFAAPVGLVIGNSDLQDEVSESLPQTLFYATKEVLGATAALCKPPAATAKEIRAIAAQAVEIHKTSPCPIFQYEKPIHLSIETYRREMAARAAEINGVELTSERQFTVISNSAIEAFSLAWRGITRAQDESPHWLK